AYAASKARLFEMQSEGGFTVIATDDSSSAAIEAAHGHKGMRIGAAKSPDQVNWPALQGPHNARNASAAHAVSLLLGVPDEAFDEALRTYPGLPHRMERIREWGGILFVNDSKATNPTATAPALAAFEKIRWICGGQAKTDNLDECAPSFGHVRKAYIIGEAGEL